MRLFDTEARVATVVATLLAVAGIIVALVGSGTVAIIGAALVGIAAVVMLGVDFYLVGRSEDLDRMRHHHG
jgi:hypothetical protein